MGFKIAKQFEANKIKALKCVIRMVKQSKDKKDVVGMPHIHGSDGKLMVTIEEKIKACKEYEEKLLNEENDWNKNLKMVKVEGQCERVSADDVIEALKLMNNGKTARPSGITVELMKFCEKNV